MPAPIFFFATPMRSSASRVDIAQKPNNSGQILDQRWKIFFVIFTKLIPRRNLFVFCNNFGVDGMCSPGSKKGQKVEKRVENGPKTRKKLEK